MKQVCIVAGIVMLFHYSFSQTVYKDRRDGEIYFKFQNNYRLNVANDEAGNVPLNQFEVLNSLFKKYDVTNVQRSFYFAKEIELKQTIRIYFKQADAVDAFIKDLAALPFAEYAEHVPLLRHTFTPNDLPASNFNNGRWHLHKINATAAWDISTGSTNIKVAIVDDAVQTTHPDLAANMLAGRDVALGTNDPNPPTTAYSHGTHVAGCASAVSNNGVGYASIGFSVKIIPVKATNSAAGVSHGYEGVTWASNNGANVINMSWGSEYGGNTGNNVMNAAFNSGKTLVAAAGNDGVTTTFYPAGYTNVIAVASTSSNDAKSSFSNYGTWVTVSAPGSNIYSTIPTNSYAIYNGTSMASPITAGLCGLVLSVNPSFTPTQVRNCIVSSADNINSVNSSYIGQLGSGRINAYQALLCAQGSISQYDAGVRVINAPTGSSCSNTFTPQVVLRNYGSNTLTAATIQYRIDNGSIASFNWTGNLASQAEVTVNLPAQTTTTGAHTFTANTTATINNNQSDANANNNSKTNNFVVFGAPGISLPFTETFESASLTTNNWTIENPDNSLSWELITTGGTTPGNKSVRIPFYSYDAAGQRDGLITPPLNFTGFDTVKLRFDHAYRRYNQSSSDSLIVYVSTNCGATWTRIFARGENGSGTFATSNTSTVDFIPAINTDWCLAGTVGTACYEINLNAYKGNNAVRIKFESYNNFQNNLYLDNINIVGLQTGVPPTAQFSATPTSVCSGSYVTFTNLSTNQPTSYNWSFPGGFPTSSTDANPSIRYDAPGNYNVTLTAINGNGQNTTTKTAYITVHPKPSINGSYSPQQICDGDEVTLNASGASSYEWSSGLSHFTGNNIPVTIFGTTVYKIIGIDNNGCKDSITLSVVSSAKPTAGVTADFSVCSGAQTTLNASGGSTYNWSNGESGNFIFVSPTQTTRYTVTVSFPNSVCVDSASVNVTVLQKKTTQLTETTCGNASYLFNGQVIVQSGTYSALLTAENGCDSTVNLDITMLDEKSTNLADQFCSGESYTFNNQTLTQGGIFTATYTAVNSCDSVVTLTLTENTSPSPTVIQNGNELSTQNFSSYRWQFAGVDVPNGNNQSVTATQNGDYAVVVTDANGCEGISAAQNVIGVNVSKLNANNNLFSLYPNPAINVLKVEIHPSQNLQSQISIYDYTGKKIENVVTEKSIVAFDVSKLAAAIYFIEVIQGNTVLQKRFTKL
jgi:serine protease